jgi:RNA polymerase primary sigma factor
MLQAAEEFRDEHCGAEPTLEELTTLIGASSAVMKATMRSGRATISLQQPCTFEKDGDTLEDRIEDDRSGSDPFTNCSEKELVEIVRNVLASLSPKEAAILRLRFGLVEEVDPTDFPITDEEEQQIMSGKGLT